MTNASSQYLAAAFEKAHTAPERMRPTKRKAKKRTPPFSIRFSDEELSQLKQDAGVLSLAAYIRLKVFTESADTSKQRKKLRRKHYSPSAELAVVSQMLGHLGQSELAGSMDRIAKGAENGTLPVTPELEDEISQACEAIAEIRIHLIEALGVKAE